MADSEAQARLNWGVGSKVEVYSNSKSTWFPGDVAQVFTDSEGEWLEIRYDGTMSKQVQRYSTDIRPVASKPVVKVKAPESGVPSPFKTEEMTLRTGWGKGDHCEIFSNTHQQWHLGEIVDIVNDEEGEWLNIVWAMNNGEAMSKQVQRFSTDVRAPQGEAPPPKATPPVRFSHRIKPSTHSFPATKGFRHAKKLNDINEEDQRAKSGRPANMRDWQPAHVKEWVDTLGKAYGKYKKKFSTTTGVELVHADEDSLKRMGIPNLHRLKLLLEINRSSETSLVRETNSVDVLNWDVKKVREWVQQQPAPLKQYAQRFHNHGVDGVLLFHLEEEDLHTVGIKLHRKRVLEMIKAFARTVFPEDEEQKGEQEESDPHKADPAPGRMKRARNSSRRLSRQLSAEEILAGPEINQRDLLDLLASLSELTCAVAQVFSAGPLQQKAKELHKKAEEFMAVYSADARDDGSAPQDSAASSIGRDRGKRSRKAARHNPDDEEVLTNTPTSESGTWLATLQSRSGHKRRSSLIMDQSHLADLEEEASGDIVDDIE